jgi:hypothetical protein
MTRSIAILTLALTAALSAGQTFAGAATDNDCDGLTSDANIRQDHYEVLNNSQPERDLDALIAIIAFEYGLDAACEMLMDMGFSRAEAYDMVLEAALAIYGVRRYL